MENQDMKNQDVEGRLHGNEPVVQVQQLTKKIGSKTIIRDLSFHLYPGEVFGLLGPNGAGKTTTIRMMVGLMSLSEGDVHIKGFSIQKQFEQAMAHVGAMIENPEMYAYLSGYRNLVHYARMVQGVTAERIREVVEWVGLEQRIHDQVGTYSLGMRQRLGLAQAVLHSPSVLILDEPTNGLDPEGIRDMRNHLLKLTREEGMAVLVSSHLLAEMELMCDRVGIIQNGTLMDIQPVRDVGESNRVLVSWTVQPVAKAKSWAEKEYPHQVSNVRDEGFDMSIPKDQIPHVIAQFVRDGIRIYEVRTTVKSLEDRFLEVTGGRLLDEYRIPHH